MLNTSGRLAWLVYITGEQCDIEKVFEEDDSDPEIGPYCQHLKPVAQVVTARVHLITLKL